MSASFPIVGGGPEPLRGAAPERRAGGAGEASFAARMEAAREATEVTSEPPPEVRAEVQAAARCADQLHKMGRELRFEQDEESGRIRVEVRDLDGNVLRRVPPSEVFDFATGKATS